MLSIDEITTQLREECEEDYVGVWEIARLLRDNEQPADAPVQAVHVAEVAGRLLADPTIEVGQFDGGEFRGWAGDVRTQVARLRSELLNLGRDPDIGEVAWFAKRE